jgi:hypothetical protein
MNKLIKQQITELESAIRKLELQLVTQEVPEETVIAKREQYEAKLEILYKKLEAIQVLVNEN